VTGLDSRYMHPSGLAHAKTGRPQAPHPNLHPPSSARTMALRGRTAIGTFYRPDSRDIVSWKAVNLNNTEELSRSSAKALEEGGATFLVKNRPRSAGRFIRRTANESFDLNPEHRLIRSRNDNGNTYRSDVNDTRGWSNVTQIRPIQTTAQLRVRSYIEAKKLLPSYRTVDYDVITFKPKEGPAPPEETSVPKARTMALRGRTAIGSFYRADASDFASWNATSPNVHRPVPPRPIRSAEVNNGNFIGIFEGSHEPRTEFPIEHTSRRDHDLQRGWTGIEEWKGV